MNRTLQILLALGFVVVLGVVLMQPILDAVDSADLAAGPTPQSDGDEASSEPNPRTEDPAASPTEDAEPGTIEGPLRNRPLFEALPKGCLRPDPAAGQGSGIAVSTSDGRVEFGSPSGPDSPPGSIHARRFLGFNATAALYAAQGDDGRAWVASAGVGRSGADEMTFANVVWSPVSACGVGIGDDGSLSTVPGGRRLVDEGVRSVAFSPSGRKLAIVLDEGKTASIWITDRSGTRMREIRRVRTSSDLHLRSWSPDGTTLYLSQDPMTGVSFVTLGPDAESDLLGSAGVMRFEQCSGRLLGVVEGGRIAEIEPGGVTPLTEPGFTAVSCAPNGSFMAGIFEGSLVLLDREGGILRQLTVDAGYRDRFVDWGIGGAGLLFGRAPESGGPAELWHIAEGGTARPTGLVYPRANPEAVDWSASPPTGLP